MSAYILVQDTVYHDFLRASYSKELEILMSLYCKDFHKMIEKVTFIGLRRAILYPYLYSTYVMKCMIEREILQYNKALKSYHGKGI